MRTTFLVVLMALVIAAPTQAANAGIAELSAKQVSVDGMLAASNMPLTIAGAAFSAFEVPATIHAHGAASMMHIRTDYFEADYIGAAAAYDYAIDQQSETAAEATFDLTDVEPGLLMFIVPHGDGATLSTNGPMALAPSSGQVAVPDRIKVPGQPPIAQDISSSLAVSGSPFNEWSVEGSFTLVLYQATAVVRQTGRTDEHWAGYRQSATQGLPSETTAVAGHERAQQLYITFIDGRLDFGGPAAASFGMFATQADLRVAGEVAWTDAVGNIADGRERVAVAGDITLDGDLIVLVRAAGDALASQVGGDVHRATVAGQDANWVAPMRPAEVGFPWWIVTWVTAGVALVVAGAATYRRRSDRRLMARAEGAYEQGLFAQAVGPAGRLRKHRLFGPDALLVEIESLARLGRHAEAQARLASSASQRLGSAIHAYLEALVHTLCGRRAEARDAIARCLAADASMAAALADEPLLHWVREPRKATEGYV